MVSCIPQEPSGLFFSQHKNRMQASFPDILFLCSALCVFLCFLSGSPLFQRLCSLLFGRTLNEPFDAAGLAAEKAAVILRLCHHDVLSAGAAVKFAGDRLRLDIAGVFPIQLLAAARAEFCAAVVRRRHANELAAFDARKTPKHRCAFCFLLMFEKLIMPIGITAAFCRTKPLRYALLLKALPTDNTFFYRHRKRPCPNSRKRHPFLSETRQKRTARSLRHRLCCPSLRTSKQNCFTAIAELQRYPPPGMLFTHF